MSAVKFKGLKNDILKIGLDTVKTTLGEGVSTMVENSLITLKSFSNMWSDALKTLNECNSHKFDER